MTKAVEKDFEGAPTVLFSLTATTKLAVTPMYQPSHFRVWKMSQNREIKDRDGVVTGLRKRGAGDDLKMAEIVSGYIKPGS